MDAAPERQESTSENLLPATPLQFDTAEYVASQPAEPMCSVCKRPITQTYYTANKAVLCDQCHGQYQDYLMGGSGVLRAVAAACFGLVASLAGAGIWYAVRKATNTDFGLVAIFVGLMVGIAVRKGSKGRGGWFYQTLAVALTYLAVSAVWVPDLAMAVLKAPRNRPAAANVPEKNAAAGKAHPQDAGKDPAAQNRRDENADKNDGDAGHAKHRTLDTVPGLAYFLIIVLYVSLKLPVLHGMESPIGLLIIGIALYEAWKINKGSSIRIFGPFQVGRAAAPRC